MSDTPMTVQVDIGLVAELIARDLSEQSANVGLIKAAAALCAKLQTSIVHDDGKGRSYIERRDADEVGSLIQALDAQLRALPPNKAVPAQCCEAELPGAWNGFCVEESKPAVANHCPPGDDSKSLQWLPLPESSNAKIGAAAPLCGPLEPSERRNSEAPTSGVRVAVDNSIERVLGS